MTNRLQIGLTNTIYKIVSKEDSALKIGSGSVEVFATPALIALIEKTAHESMIAYLEKDSISVGTEISIKHLKASKIGSKVKSETKIISVKGSKIIFECNVWENEILIGKGLHTRYIVNRDKFLSL